MNHSYIDLHVTSQTLQKDRMHWSFTILSCNEWDGTIETEKIGHGSFYILHTNWVHPYETLHDIAAQESWSLFYALESVHIKGEPLKDKYNPLTTEIDGKIAFLETMFIVPSYRNKRIATEVLYALLHFFSQQTVDWVLLRPFPFEEDEKKSEDLKGRYWEFEEKLKQLQRFYERFGFIITRGYDKGFENTPHMILKLSQDKET